MPASTVSDATFAREVLRSRIPVLVEFFAKRGTQRKAAAPTLDEVAQDLQGKVKVAKLDVDRNPAVRSDYEIYSMPTLILFKNGKPAARRTGMLSVKELEGWISSELMLALAQQTVPAERRAVDFELSNGMVLVVIPDHRAPVVTHMICYRVGAADEPQGASGISHFLGHLMWKSTGNFAAGDFSKIILALGGQHSAFADADITCFVERISVDHLETVMKMEADRMVHLRLTHQEVDQERQVIIEERRTVSDNNPDMLLEEQMKAVLYLSHPYATPISGWPEELAGLSRDDAVDFYRRHYAPNNAVLVVSGDVSPERVRQAAEETYGTIPARPEVERRGRTPKPLYIAARRVTLSHPRAGNATFRRDYLVPSYVNAKPGEVEALELLAKMLGQSSSGRLHSQLVVKTKSAASTRCYLRNTMADFGALSLHVVSSSGGLGRVEADVDEVLEEIRLGGVTEQELARAKKSLIANYIFEANNQERLVRRYGSFIAIGRTIDQLESWPAAVAGVTAGDVKKVANEYLDARRSATGWLLREGDDSDGGENAIS